MLIPEMSCIAYDTTGIDKHNPTKPYYRAAGSANNIILHPKIPNAVDTTNSNKRVRKRSQKVPKT